MVKTKRFSDNAEYFKLLKFVEYYGKFEKSVNIKPGGFGVEEKKTIGRFFGRGARKTAILPF